MDREGTRVADPAAHQPSNAELQDAVRLGAVFEALPWTIACGGTGRAGETEAHR